MGELNLVVEEADAELTSLRLLIEHSEAKVDGQFMLGGQARLTALNSSILYIAASFEEAVRQLGRAYVDGLIKKMIPLARMEAIKSGLWETSSQGLVERQYGGRAFDVDIAKNYLKILQDFCLEERDISLMRDNAVYNKRNMRAKEVNFVFGRLGISEICNKIGRANEFKTFFVVDSVAMAQDQFILFLNSFYDVRNKATHELGLFRAQGLVDSKRYIEFFAITVRRIAKVLQDDLDALPDR